MRKLILGVLAVGGLVAGGGRAQAWQWGHTGPYAQSATFPLANPPGWFTNTYSFAWYYPWFAYYNYSHGPYANWMASGGYAGYAYHGPAGYYYYPNVQPAQPYIGEWSGRVQSKLRRGGGGAYDSLQGLTAYPLHPPRELKDDKKDEKGQDEKK